MKLSNAIKTLFDHCDSYEMENSCEGCPFWSPTNCMFGKVPASWDIDTMLDRIKERETGA